MLLGTRGPLCVGYRPKCGAVRVQDTGVDYSVLCRDVASAGPGRSPRVTGIGFREAYSHAPWWQVCARWPVRQAAASSAAPVSSDVPTLILVGGLAASTPAGQVRARTRGLTNASLVVVPTGSQNVFGPECVFEIRNAWLADPRPIAEPPDCLEQRLEW